MISRRKIISRSLDNLDAISQDANQDEDVWNDLEKLCKNHIDEVVTKWKQIDDEIWAKVIVFEGNRRIAKAYARSSVLTFNGSKHNFDGVRIGLNGFENPMRDFRTAEVKKKIGDGFKLKMDDSGNILIKSYSKSNIFVQNTSQFTNDETSIGNDILQLPNQMLPITKSGKLFDMQKFNSNINNELARTYPDRKRLERQCLSAISLVKSADSLINSPMWILVINLVAIDMLNNKITNIKRRKPASSSDENSYSIISSQQDLSSIKSKSTKTILRKNMNGPPLDGRVLEKPEFFMHNGRFFQKPSKKDKDTKNELRQKQDDPYYCGLLARIPNFIKTQNPPKKKDSKINYRKISQQNYRAIPIGSFHHQNGYIYPYNMQLYPRNFPLSQSQVSLSHHNYIPGPGVDWLKH